MNDPFTVLGVGEDAGDEQIKQRYLALVRAFPPDREPERFQAYRAAYEALRDQRKRLEVKLLRTNDTALSQLKLRFQAPSGPVRGRATRATVTALLLEGIDRACTSVGSSPEPPSLARSQLK
jgi:curved DNA-binding protein CbpA